MDTYYRCLTCGALTLCAQHSCPTPAQPAPDPRDARIAELEETVRGLSRKADKYEEQRDHNAALVSERDARIAEMERELRHAAVVRNGLIEARERYRQALEYYACPEHYEPRETLGGSRPPGVLADQGAKAREAQAHVSHSGSRTAGTEPASESGATPPGIPIPEEHRDSVAQQFEVARSTVDRWVSGAARPHPALRERIVAAARHSEAAPKSGASEHAALLRLAEAAEAYRARTSIDTWSDLDKALADLRRARGEK